MSRTLRVGIQRLVVAAAWLIMAGMARRAAAEAPPDDGLVVIVQVPVPGGIDPSAMADAISLYVRDLDPGLVHAAAPSSGEGLRERSLSEAAARNARYAAWLTWQGGEASCHLVDRTAGSGGTASFSASLPPDPDSSFYRLVALKLSSLVQVASLSAVPPKEQPEPSAAPVQRPVVEPPGPPIPVDVAPTPRPHLLVGAEGAIPVWGGSALGTVHAGGSAHWQQPGWKVGVAVTRAWPATRHVEHGVARSRSTRLAGRTGIAIAEIWPSTLTLWVGAEAGVIFAESEGRLDEGGPWREDAATLPVVGSAAVLRLSLGYGVSLWAGPRADFMPTRYTVLVRGDEAIVTGRVHLHAPFGVDWAL